MSFTEYNLYYSLTINNIYVEDENENDDDLSSLSMSGCSQDVDSSEEDANEVEGSTGHATLLVLQA
jgi:hypothetical protein